MSRLAVKQIISREPAVHLQYDWQIYLREIISPFAQLENRDLTLDCTVLASHVKIILDILVFLYNYFALRRTKTEETYNANSELHW